MRQGNRVLGVTYKLQCIPVLDSLSVGENVVIDGQVKLRAGVTVKPTVVAPTLKAIRRRSRLHAVRALVPDDANHFASYRGVIEAKLNRWIIFFIG